LNLPWSYRFEWSNEDNCYVVSVEELKGCVADGKTIEEAIKMIKSALNSYITGCLEAGFEIPEPLKPIKKLNSFPS
jgi:antitoxin HicB